MAFTFNWTPLTTATSSPEFYTHAKSLLTTALNNASSPATGNSDITVEDLNLGQIAPEIEVLEIGDLADDKFRGVFRICYSGDACLTLRTRIQINPLYAHLSSGFAAPDMLAAHTPLSIPLQVTLSDFKLSGFAIVVFSRAKGITLVFRNDPLEHMVVQSTFDSVPFVRKHLQDLIEHQVRCLFQEELPMAVYRLSLRLFNPDHVLDLDATPKSGARCPLWNDQEPADHDHPFAEHALRLTALLDSHNTLALFTPGIRGTLYRAKPQDLIQQLLLLEAPVPTLRAHDGRPGLVQSHSSASLAGRGSAPGRKKRHRVVDLRKKRPESDQALSDTASAPELRPQREAVRGSVSTAYSDCPVRLAAEQEAEYARPVKERRQPVEYGRTAAERRQPVEYARPGTREKAPLPVLGKRPQLREMPRPSSGILERAFMMKLVSELQKRAEMERADDGGSPPAY